MKMNQIRGYAARFNEKSQDLGGFREIVLPGAFSASLASRADTLARYNHVDILGRTSAGTLRLREDAQGLFYEIDLIDTSVARDLTANIVAGNIRASSFCFKVNPKGGERWSNSGGEVLRELLSVDLIDVSPVDRPAYACTTGHIQLVTAAEDYESIEDSAPLPTRRSALGPWEMDLAQKAAEMGLPNFMKLSPIVRQEILEFKMGSMRTLNWAQELRQKQAELV